MEVLKSGIDVSAFFTRVARAQQRVLFLDYDGTLAPFTPKRDKAFPYPGIREILQELLEREDTRLILITGRWSQDLTRLLGFGKIPEIWGSHGWESLMPDGRYEVGEFDETALQGLADADDWVEREGLSERVEYKPGCLAIHWRGLEESEVDRIRGKIEEHLSKLSRRKGLHLCEFDGGLELRISGRSKGYAVTAVLNELDGNVAAAYLGDDLTDEDAFTALEGKGLSVLVRKDFRDTAADLWLKPPDELLQFLQWWIESSS